MSLGIVIVHGARVTRFNIPRWVAWGALGLQTALVAAAVGLWGTPGLVRREIDALRQRAEGERRLAETFQARVAAVSDELAEWKTLHAKIWKAFGPDPDAAPTETADEDGPRLRDLKRVVNRTSRLLSALPLGWPIRGPVNSEFGLRRSPWTGRPEQHRGIDIGSPPGTPVRSPVAGTVVAASSYGRLGKHVAVDHGNGVRSLYGHLEALDVKNGERVERGQVLGLVGNTGRSTGPHLHYELLVDGKAVDPRGFLSER